MRIADRVHETTTTTGTGTVNLAGAVVGRTGFVAGAGDDQEVGYAIAGQGGKGVVVISRASPSSAGSADFALASGYREFRLFGWLKPSTDAAVLWARFSNDAGSTFRAGASDYSWGRMALEVPATGADAGDAADAQIVASGAVGNDTGEMVEVDLRIIGARSASVRTSLDGSVQHFTDGGLHVVGRIGGSVIAAQEVNDAVRLLFSSGSIASGELTLEGIPETNAAADQWEVGIGTINDASPDTLSRDTVLASSNAGALVNLSAGTKDVFITLPSAMTEHVIKKATPSAAATVDFLLPSGYRAYRLVGWLKPATDNVDLNLRLSNDAGATYRAGVSDYAWGRNQVNISAGTASIIASAADSELTLAAGVGNAAGEFISFDVRLAGARNSGVKTSFTGATAYITATPTAVTSQVGGWNATEEVNDAVRVMFSSGNAAGEITLIGIP